MWILDHKRDTLYRVSDRVFSLSKDEALELHYIDLS